jgi:hypothetical protein
MIDLELVESPSIRELNERVDICAEFLEELKETDVEGIERLDLIEVLLSNARSELQKVKGAQKLEELPLQQQARIFADTFTLQEILSTYEDPFDDSLLDESDFDDLDEEEDEDS